MFGWTKGNKPVPEEQKDKVKLQVNNEDENKLVWKVTKAFEDARSARMADHDDTGLSIEEIWDDEDKMQKGGGLQWSTTLAYRSKKDRNIRPNSEDNFIFNALSIQHANITATDPTMTANGVEDTDIEIAQKITCMSQFNDKRNNFLSMWDKVTMDFISKGPTVVRTYWDNDWMGGVGPRRWVGDIRVKRIKKEDFFPDPAIADLEEDINEGAFVIERLRKKVKWVEQMFPKFQFQISEESLDTSDSNDTTSVSDMYEGPDPEMTYVYYYEHRGYPEYMPKERSKELLEASKRYMEQGDYYRSQDYKDASKGDLFGVHGAYVCNGKLLEYIPYLAEHGEYSYDYTTEYNDDESPWGFGEVRNTKIPQLLHNKADEIEIDAMGRQGLGGHFFQKGAISRNQLKEIEQKNGKAGMLFELDNINLIKDRNGVSVPASITNYKEHKQRMVETIGSNTPIQQGLSPGSNVAMGTIQELGARSDVRTKKITKKLERLYERVCKKRIALMAQFYTEDRYYRIKGSDGKYISGTINRNEMMLQWIREEIPVTDLMGNPVINPMTGQPEVAQRVEYFVPEFDISVTILSDKPTDRNYYTGVAQTMHGLGLMTGEDLWYTLEEGKFPPKEEILKHVAAQNIVLQMTQQMQQLLPEQQQELMMLVQGAMQGLVQQNQQIEMMQKQIQKNMK